MNSHFHTHVNTHFCYCGRAHVSAHTHVHTYDKVAQVAPQVAPQVATQVAPQRSPSPVARHTRSKTARANWESQPWVAEDADINHRLKFLRASDDPWERSLIPAVEQEAIQRASKRSKAAY